MVMRENEHEALFKLKKAVADRYQLIDFKLFGSKAKGVDSLGSDIDVMIELREVTPDIELELAEMVFEINLAHDCFVSPVLFSQHELEEGPMDQSPLWRAIQRDGIAL